MRRSRNLLAGLLDSAFAALGTFLAGVLAVRELDVRMLAVYAIVGAAAIFAMPLSRQLVYLPSQVAANVLTDLRVPVMWEEIRRALPFSALGAAIVLIVGVSLADTHDPAAVLVLAATAAAMVVVSPVQDHVRSCLHLVDRHLRAAACSVVLAVTVASVVAAASLVPHPPGSIVAVPFGALVLGNAVSAAVGLVLLRDARRFTGYVPRRFVERAHFLLSELSVQGAWFACTYLILLLAGPAAVAALEAARITAAPVFILSAAVSTFMAPALLRRLNPLDPDRVGAVRELLVATAFLVGGAICWVVALSVAGDLVGSVLNKPFDLPLTLVRCLASSVEGVATLVSIAMLALQQARATFVLSVLAAVVGLVGTAVLAPLIGAFALPVSQGGGTLARLGLGLRSASRGIDARVSSAHGPLAAIER